MEKADNSSIYVGDLDDSVTEKHLKGAFSRVGPIESVVCCRDLKTGKFLNYGFVNFTTVQAARIAQDTLRHVVICGKQARVMPAMKNQPEPASGTGNLYVKNLSLQLVDDKALYSYFVAHGPILSAKVARNNKGSSKGYGFVQYENAESAERAIEKLHKKLFCGRELSVSDFIPSKEKNKPMEDPPNAASKTRQEAQTADVGPSNLQDRPSDEELLLQEAASTVREASTIRRLIEYIPERPGRAPAKHKVTLRNLPSARNQEMQAPIEKLISDLRDQRRAAQETLYEFRRLGQIQEANLLRPLHKIASFSLVVDGFQKNKAQIMRLCEDVMLVVGSGPPSAQETAAKLLKGIDQQPDWHQTGSPCSFQVLSAFANGTADEIILDLPKALIGKRSRISLTQASQIHQDVATGCHLALVKILQAQLQFVSDPDQAVAYKSQQTIDLVMSLAAAISTSWCIGQATSFSTMRGIKIPTPLHQQGNFIRQVLAALAPELRSKLWHHWDQFQAEAAPLICAATEAEQNFETVLNSFPGESEDRALLALLEAVKELISCHDAVSEPTYRLDIQCAFSLSLLQLGVWVALDLPDFPIAQILALDLDPYLRFSNYFSTGAIPRG